jgi:hypothetical protein
MDHNTIALNAKCHRYCQRSIFEILRLFVDAGNSRFYAGIHYQSSIDAGLIWGRKVRGNILRGLGFNSIQQDE